MQTICAIIPLNDPSPIAFLNVYEEGDRWDKIQGCEACNEEFRKRCCGNCPMVTPDGSCWWQLVKGTSSKPFSCIIPPIPSTYKSYCALRFKCVKGSNKGKIRYVNDRGTVFR